MNYAFDCLSCVSKINNHLPCKEAAAVEEHSGGFGGFVAIGERAAGKYCNGFFVRIQAYFVDR